MVGNRTEATFQRGIDYFRQQRLIEAANAFRAAFKESPDNPLYLSYYGLIIALAEDCLQDGLTFCQAAIQRAPYQMDLYLNLSRVYQHVHQRQKALETLVQGMSYDRSQRLFQEMKRMGVRRKPFFTRLSRDNPLNILLGRLTYRLRKPASPIAH
jgi:predicted Zn-dependent protease